MTFRNYILFFFFLVATFLSQPVFSQQVITPGEEDEIRVTSTHYRVIRDCESELSIENLKTSPEAEEKLSAKEDCPGYWLVFKVKNESREHKDWFLEITDPHIDTVALFSESGKISRSGFSIPFNERKFFHKNFLYKLSLKPGETKEYYLKLNPHYGISFPFLIRSDNYLLFYSLNEYILLGMYYGIILIMALYNLFIFFSVREKVYLYYVFYAFSCGFNSFSEDGLGFQYLWPDFPEVNIVLGTLTPLFLLTTFIPYSNSFLKVREKLPAFYKLILASYGFYLLIFIGFLSGVVADEIRSYIYLLPFTLVFLGGIKVYLNGYKPAKYFLLGYSFIFMSLAIYILRIYGIVPTNLFTIYCFNIGFIMEVVVLSFALGERLRLEKKEKEEGQKKVIVHLQENQKLKDNLNKQLEEKIRERTKDLQESNQQLGEVNQQLEKAYEQLRNQSKEIARMNIKLNADNKELEGNVKELSRARVMFKEVNFDEFSKIYPSDDTCLKYLSEIKWSKGYKCRKCKNDSYSKGRTSYSRRCTKCGYQESATAFTIFHRNRLPLTKAFYMVFLVSTSKKEVSSEELSRKLEIRQKTCWAFKQKIATAINESSIKKFKAENWGSLFLSN